MNDSIKLDFIKMYLESISNNIKDEQNDLEMKGRYYAYQDALKYVTDIIKTN